MTGFVYLIRCGPLHKIGASRMPRRRVAEVQFDTKRPCELVAHRPAENARRLERALHVHFADKRVKGEWFSLEPEDVDWFRALTDDDVAGLLPLAEPRKLVQVRLVLGNEPHASLRVLAAKSGLSMAAYCEALVMEAVRAGRVLKTPVPAKGKGKKR